MQFHGVSCVLHIIPRTGEKLVNTRYVRVKFSGVTNPDGQDITVLLAAWNGGDGHALDRLMEIVYPELRRVACRSCYMSRATPWLSPQARQTQARAGRVLITHPYEKKL